MAAITWTDVEGLAPELASTPAAAQALYVENANAHFNADTMGGEGSANLKLARIYHAAHFATVASFASSGTAGPIVETSLGDERIKFGSALSVTFGSSAYGKLLENLSKCTPLARLPLLI